MKNAVFNRRDIIEAHFLYLFNRHEGLTSDSYKRLKKVSRFIKQDQHVNTETLSDNGKRIFLNLIAQ